MNWRYIEGQWTSLHWACNSDHAEVVKLLLAHPDIDVNAKDREGATPAFTGCHWADVARLLLKDPRVDFAATDANGCTPLWHLYSRFDAILLLIASGRDLGDLNQKALCHSDLMEYTAVEMA